MRSHAIASVVAVAAVLTVPLAAQTKQAKAFETPERAARALAHAASADGMDELLAIFGPGGEALLASSDAATAQRNRQTFAAAFAEEWRVQDLGVDRKELVIGREGWPFPVPLVKTTRGWVFDVASGKEEILNRRIGRNELATIQTCRAYVRAQYTYASAGRDGRPAGIYAQRFASDPGKQNGLYWPTKAKERRSPLGDLVAQAADDGQARDTTAATGTSRTPFHGYYFRILTAQGPAASGGAKNYLVDGEMRGGFALVAWPAEYDTTGIMTFLVNQDGVVFEKDLGPHTAAQASTLTRFDPDLTWHTSVLPATRSGTQSAR